MNGPPKGLVSRVSNGPKYELGNTAGAVALRSSLDRCARLSRAISKSGTTADKLPTPGRRDASVFGSALAPSIRQVRG